MRCTDPDVRELDAEVEVVLVALLVTDLRVVALPVRELVRS